MITKKTFVDTMNKLQKLDEKMNAVDNALKDLSMDFCGFYVPDFFDIVIEILQEVMNDKDDWIPYFVYEKDWLRDINLGDVEIGNEPIKIETWEDVYDLIEYITKYNIRAGD